MLIIFHLCVRCSVCCRYTRLNYRQKVPKKCVERCVINGKRLFIRTESDVRRRTLQQSFCSPVTAMTSLIYYNNRFHGMHPIRNKNISLQKFTLLSRIIFQNPIVSMHGNKSRVMILKFIEYARNLVRETMHISKINSTIMKIPRKKMLYIEILITLL